MRQATLGGESESWLRLQLSPDFAALECGTVNVDVEVPVLEALKLSVIELRPSRNRPDALRRFDQWNNNGAILPGGGKVNMGHRSVNTNRHDAT